MKQEQVTTKDKKVMKILHKDKEQDKRARGVRKQMNSALSTLAQIYQMYIIMKENQKQSYWKYWKQKALIGHVVTI